MKWLCIFYLHWTYLCLIIQRDLISYTLLVHQWPVLSTGTWPPYHPSIVSNVSCFRGLLRQVSSKLKICKAMCLELGPALGWSRFIFKWNFTYLPWLQYLNMNESLQVSTHFKANLVSFKLISNLTSLHIN